jgi:NAD-reducing hydrogenase large subunit
VSERYVNGEKLEEGALNRVAAVVRAYDPCLSCSTHALGQPAVRIRLVDSQGRVLDEVAN